MHTYLRSVGFSKIKTGTEVKKLIKSICDEHTATFEVMSDGIIYVEYLKEIADGVGLIVIGERDKDDRLVIDNYFPYVINPDISANEEVFVYKKVDCSSYTGMCDDSRVGVSLIFHLNNSIEYLSLKNKPERTGFVNISLSALSTKGTILLPIHINEKEKTVNTNRSRTKLMEEAKNGDMKAMEDLTINNIDLFASVSMRIKKEDILSIVNTSFIPYGSESDLYNITGNITEVSEKVNSITGEKLYKLSVMCNDISLMICINAEDLTGEPQVGRRFRGTIWLQGEVMFEHGLSSAKMI